MKILYSALVPHLSYRILTWGELMNDFVKETGNNTEIVTSFYDDIIDGLIKC